MIGGAKAAASTSNAWVALGVLPIVAEDLSANEPRSRLYGLAAISLSRIVWRYQALDEARVKLNADLDDLRGRTRNVCGVKARLEAIKSAADRAGGKILFADQISRMTSRCAALTAALQQLSAASEQWGSSGDFVAHSFIKDAIEFDDTVARLDRSLRTTPAGAFRTVLATPFSVASNIIRGGADIQGYQQRTLSTFSNPIIFELTRLPDLPIPNAVPADLTRSESLREWAEEKPSATLTSAALETRGELRQQTEETCNDLNELALEVNALIAAAGEVKRMNDLSVLTINYSVIDRPVTLAPPAPKP